MRIVTIGRIYKNNNFLIFVRKKHGHLLLVMCIKKLEQEAVLLQGKRFYSNVKDLQWLAFRCLVWYIYMHKNVMYKVIKTQILYKTIIVKQTFPNR